AGALLVTAGAALALSTWRIGREQEKTRQAYRAEAGLRREADTQRTRAERRSRLARRAVDDMYTQVAAKWLANQPRMEPVQREFLKRARSIYDELAEEVSHDPEVRREA